MILFMDGSINIHQIIDKMLEHVNNHELEVVDESGERINVKDEIASRIDKICHEAMKKFAGNALFIEGGGIRL